ncbi:glycosyltransferase family 9 protein [bacterium]|nr:glycosyltransferase family 9 protein [bacterium]
MENILVIQTAFSGDLILTTPFVALIRKYMPDSRITLLTTPVGEEIFRNNPNLDQILVYDKHLSQKTFGAFTKLARTLKVAGFSMALLPHRSFRSGLLSWLARIPRRIGFQKAPGAIFYSERVFRDPGQIEIVRICSLLKAIGHDPLALAPQLFPTKDDLERAKDFFTAHNLLSDTHIIVGIAPGSFWGTKRYPWQNYRKLITLLLQDSAIRIVLIGGRDDHELVEDIRFGMGERVINATGYGGIPATAALIGKFRLLVGNDSTPGHIASAVGTAVLTIFGPTVPEFGFSPYGEDNRFLQVPLKCRPCSTHGPQTCPRKHHHCMTLIEPEKVFQTVKTMLEKTPDV